MRRTICTIQGYCCRRRQYVIHSHVVITCILSPVTKTSKHLATYVRTLCTCASHTYVRTQVVNFLYFSVTFLATYCCHLYHYLTADQSSINKYTYTYSGILASHFTSVAPIIGSAIGNTLYRLIF